MNPKNKKAPRAPMNIFAQAFRKLYKFKPEDLHIEVLEENKSAAIIYHKNLYIIKSREALSDEVKQMLSDSNMARLIHLPIWLKSSYGLLGRLDFRDLVINSCENAEQVKIVELAIRITDFTTNKGEVFWSTLQKLDGSGTLYGKAVVIGARIYDFEENCEGLLDRQILHGDAVYNRFVDGLFKEVKLPQHTGELLVFYIYSAQVRQPNWI